MKCQINKKNTKTRKRKKIQEKMNQYTSLLLVLLILCVASSKSIYFAKVVDVDVICKEASKPFKLFKSS
jgi:hypothetical protein